MRIYDDTIFEALMFFSLAGGFIYATLTGI